VLGAALGALALALLTYALIAAPDGATSPAVFAPAMAGLVLAWLFVRVERRRPEPMLPPALFRIRLFTAVNVVTLCVYGAFGGFFFLAALQLQVVAGYSALGAGTALLPTTVLMLLLSARSGDLAQRIGPRLPLTLGPLLCAAGMLLMLRVDGTHTSYAADVLPAVVVLGLGMVTLVAPLTATVLASVDTAHAGLASGVNNAAARAAGLVTVAALPLLVGMGPEAYRSAAEFGASFRRSMPLCAGLLALGAVVAWWMVRVPEEERAAHCHPECRTNCAVAAPPLETPADGARERAGERAGGEASADRESREPRESRGPGESGESDAGTP